MARRMTCVWILGVYAAVTTTAVGPSDRVAEGHARDGEVAVGLAVQQVVVAFGGCIAGMVGF